MLSVSNLHHSIARTPILCDLSFTLQAGEVVGFVGDNGSGKTTTLSIVSGCQRPSAGSVTFENQSIFDNLAHYHAQMGYLPDRLPLYPNATVLQNLTYAAKLKGVGSPQNASTRYSRGSTYNRSPQSKSVPCPKDGPSG